MASLDWWLDGHQSVVEGFSAFARVIYNGQIPEDGHKLSAPRAWPVAMFLELVLIQLALTLLIRNFIFKPLAKQLMLYNTSKPKKVTEKRLEKFIQSTSEMVTYGTFFVLGYILVARQPWTWPSINWWQGGPDNRWLSADTNFFYVLYAARYLQNLVLVVMETKRKDFVEMMIHHGVTCLLIYISYVAGFVRVGLIIMVLLDIADVPLHVGKQCLYIKEISPYQRGWFTWANVADGFFVIFALLFTFTRMVLYPYIVWSCVVEVSSWEMSGPFSIYQALRYYYTFETFCCVGLVILIQLLQIFWFKLLVHAVKNVLIGNGELKDNRSDSEVSDTEGSNKKTQ